MDSALAWSSKFTGVDRNVPAAAQLQLYAMAAACFQFSNNKKSFNHGWKYRGEWPRLKRAMGHPKKGR
eukprot:COSAG06_NODE_11310_length_1530_cov_2.847659_1_plen_67_part_10